MLPGVLLQPARRTNKLVRDHLNRTIFRTVELTEILRFHNNPELIEPFENSVET